MSRNFVNRIPDYTEGTRVVIDVQNFKKRLNSVLHTILSSNNEEFQKNPSTYHGSTGISWALLHISRSDAEITLDKPLLDLAKDYATQSMSHHSRHQPWWSFMFGEASTRAALACCLTPNEPSTLHDFLNNNDTIQNYIKACSPAAEQPPIPSIPDEFLYGRAGCLMGALIINKYTHASSVLYNFIHALVQNILHSGRRQAQLQRIETRSNKPPLWWEWHDTPYLGAAHGSMGILYILLLAASSTASTPSSSYPTFLPSLLTASDWHDIQHTLDYILSLECDSHGHPGHHGEWPTRMGSLQHEKEPLMHWCHGAVGAVYLFTQAHYTMNNNTNSNNNMSSGSSSPISTGSDGGGGDNTMSNTNDTNSTDTKYLDAAVRAGDAVWQRGLLKKGPGLCHGISGNAYALLRLYKYTNDEKWLYRAVQFAEFMSSSEFQQGARVPDHPLSLYEGWAAAACLYADLMRDDVGDTTFPLFEV